MTPVVYAASDLHGNLPEVPGDADVLLLAGDICPDFQPTNHRANSRDKGEIRQSAWLDTEFREWLRPLLLRDCAVIATWGNHDFIGEHPHLIASLHLPWTLLLDGQASVRGLSVYGTPWVPGLPYWAFYGSESTLQGRAAAIPEDTDILMTHGPPQGSGDYIPTSEKQRNKYGNFGGQYVGDPTLNAAIQRVRPAITVCGHIHEARGFHPMEHTDLYNVAAVDERYNLHEEPFTRIM